jgi:hypothetical protein
VPERIVLPQKRLPALGFGRFRAGHHRAPAAPFIAGQLRQPLLVEGSVPKNHIILRYVDGLGSVLQPARMACKLRVEYPGAIYHGLNCGNRRDPSR